MNCHPLSGLSWLMLNVKSKTPLPTNYWLAGLLDYPVVSLLFQLQRQVLPT